MRTVTIIQQCTEHKVCIAVSWYLAGPGVVTRLENGDQSTSQITDLQVTADRWSGRCRDSTVSSERTMVAAMWAALALVLVSATSVSCIRPYVTCVGCETFMECFLTCPVADYPGVNK